MMKSSELRKLMKKEITSAKLKKEIKETIKYHDDYRVDVRVYTVTEWNEYFSSDLQVEIWGDDNEYLETIVIASIRLELSQEIDDNFWEYKELCEKVYSTLKKNTLKDLQYFNIGATDDYTC